MENEVYRCKVCVTAFDMEFDGCIWQTYYLPISEAPKICETYSQGTPTKWIKEGMR